MLVFALYHVVVYQSYPTSAVAHPERHQCDAVKFWLHAVPVQCIVGVDCFLLELLGFLSAGVCMHMVAAASSMLHVLYFKIVPYHTSRIAH